VIDLGATGSGAPPVATAAPKTTIDVIEFFFGSTPQTQEKPTPIAMPTQPQATAAPAPAPAPAPATRAASILDQFLGTSASKPIVTAAPAPAPAPIPQSRPLQPVLAAHYAPQSIAAPAPAPAPVFGASALDDDPFASFGARDVQPAAATSSTAASTNTTLDENPFDELAKRGL
jgi:hypothetical protein